MTVGRHGRDNFCVRLAPGVRIENWRIGVFLGAPKKRLLIPLETPRGTSWLATKSLLAYDLAVTIQNLLEGRVSSRPEGPPNLYQLRGRWEWVTLLVEPETYLRSSCLPQFSVDNKYSDWLRGRRGGLDPC